MEANIVLITQLHLFNNLLLQDFSTYIQTDRLWGTFYDTLYNGIKRHTVLTAYNPAHKYGKYKTTRNTALTKKKVALGKAPLNNYVS